MGIGQHQGWWFAALVPLLTGCLHHEARIEQPPESPGPEGWHGETWIAGKRHPEPPGAPATTTQRSPLPRDVAVSAWRIDDGDAGTVFRQEAVLRTPLPWWQGFPFDLPVDLWPGDVVISRSLTVAPVAVVARTAAQLDAQAAADGYGQR